MHSSSHSHRYLPPEDRDERYSDLTVTWQYTASQILVVRIDRRLSRQLQVLHRVPTLGVHDAELYAEMLAHREELWTALYRLRRRVMIACRAKRYSHERGQKR